MLEKKPKQGKKFQYLRIHNLEKIGPEFTKCLVPNSPGPENIWSRIHHLVPSSLGPEFTWSRIHLIPILCKRANQAPGGSLSSKGR